MKDLISNAAILMVFMFLTGEIFKNSWTKFSSVIMKKMFLGFLAGLMGCLLMIFSIQLPQHVILDLRQFAIILSAIHGGLLGAMFTGIIMAVFRILYFGVSASSTIGFGEIILLSLICGFIAHSRLSTKEKWLFMNLSSIAIISITFGIVINSKSLLIRILCIIWIMSAAMGWIVFFFSNYIVTSNKLYKKYKRESTKDYLTGLNNVRNFNRELKNIISEAIRRHEKVSVLMLDIDFFKKVNDTYGHSAGNIILKDLAAILSSCSRSIDSISRVGGEEFCIILPNCSSTVAIEVGERIRKSVQESIFELPNQNKIHITISVGAATFPDTVHDVDAIIEEADKALYFSKESGRNQVSLNSQIINN